MDPKLRCTIQKKELLCKLDDIDKRAEVLGLSAWDRNEQKELRAQLGRLVKQEEIKQLQKYKDREIKDGDNNTKYYHAKVNGRRRKNRIVSLEQEEGIVEGDEKLMEYITKFYKELFGHPEESNI